MSSDVNNDLHHQLAAQFLPLPLPMLGNPAGLASITSRSLPDSGDLAASGSYRTFAQETARVNPFHVPRSMLNVPVPIPPYCPVASTSPIIPSPTQGNLSQDLDMEVGSVPSESSMRSLPLSGYTPPQYDSSSMQPAGGHYLPYPIDTASPFSEHDSEQLPFPPSHLRVGSETATPPPASSFHYIPSFNDAEHRLVGSTAIIEAAEARRGSRPARYFCNFPGCISKGFTAKHNLQYHLRAHNGERPFKCTRCGVAFRSRNDLKRHRRKDRKKPCQPGEASVISSGSVAKV